ncbi:MAG TPA: hypothetical protein VIE43_17760 [Thermoanaerobaculia bacterium]|nr:hypothetical protein [Thermoanaerobaculia bacterium]
MNAKVSFAIILSLLLKVGPASARIQSRSSVMLVNNSQWAIQHIYMSSTRSRYWGDDLLGSDILYPRQQVRIPSILCDYYDIKLTDEDGDACVLNQVDVCGSNQQWVITDPILLACEASTP